MNYYKAMSSSGSPNVDRTMEALNAFVLSVRKVYGQRLVQAVLFGSCSRGDERPDSGIDVAVVLDRTDNSATERNTLSDLTYDVMAETAMEIQPWPISEEEWSNPRCHDNPSLVRAMRRDGTVYALN